MTRTTSLVRLVTGANQNPYSWGSSLPFSLPLSLRITVYMSPSGDDVVTIVVVVVVVVATETGVSTVGPFKKSNWIMATRAT